MRILIAVGICILLTSQFVVLEAAETTANNQQTDQDKFDGALCPLINDQNIVQKAKNGMIEQQKRQKSFLAKITSKVEDGVKDLVEKQKEFLEWAVGPEQVATFLEIFTYFTRLDVPICIAKETLEGMNTDQNQLLEKVEEKSKNEEATPKDKYDIAVAATSAENTNPKHEVTAQQQPVYTKRKSFKDATNTDTDAKTTDVQNQNDQDQNAKKATAFKFGVGGVAKILESDGLNCEETLTQPGMVVELWLKIVDAIKKQHDGMEFSDRIKSTISQLKSDSFLTEGDPKKGSMKQKLRDELDQAEQRLADLEEHLKQKLADLGKELTSKDLGTDILSGVKNMAVWFIKPIHIVDMMQFMVYFANLASPIGIARSVIGIVGLDAWLEKASEKFYIKMYCRGKNVTPAKWLFGPNGMVPLFLRNGSLVDSAEELKTVQGKTTDTTDTKTQTATNAAATDTNTQTATKTAATDTKTQTAATDTKTQEDETENEEVYIDCEGVDRTKHVKEWDLRQQIAFLKHIGDEIIHHKGHPFHEMVGRIVQNLQEMKAGMKDKWQQVEQTWDKIETKVKSLTVKEVGNDLKEFAAWVVTPARLNQVIRLILVLVSATFPVYLTLQVMEALGITDLLLKQFQKLDEAAAKEFAKLACYRAVKKAQKAAGSENAVAQNSVPDCKNVDPKDYSNLVLVKAVDFMIGKQGLVPLFLTLGDINIVQYERNSRIKDEAALVKILMEAATKNNLSAVVPDMISYLESKFISKDYILVIFQKWNQLNTKMHDKFKQVWENFLASLHLGNGVKATKNTWNEEAWEKAENGQAMDSNDVDEDHLMGAIGSNEEDQDREKIGCTGVGCFDWLASLVSKESNTSPKKQSAKPNAKSLSSSQVAKKPKVGTAA